MGVVFLTLAEALDIHADQIERYGGETGVRDMGLLKSALAAPAMTFGGALLHADLVEMAAAYLFHLVGIHPFVDGNKRTGAAAASVFLLLNGRRLEMDVDEFADLVYSVARGELRKGRDVAGVMRAYVV